MEEVEFLHAPTLKLWRKHPKLEEAITSELGGEAESSPSLR